MLAAIKPTVGRISRYGVIPITADQDTAGPMARTVSDVAIMFGALESATPDPNDPATRVHAAAGPRLHAVPQPRRPEGRAHRHPARILLRPITLAAEPSRSTAGRARREPRDAPSAGQGTAPAGRGGLNDAQKKVMDDAIAVLKQQGAIVVDPADIPSVIDTDPKNNFMLWNHAAASTKAEARTSTARSSSSTG